MHRVLSCYLQLSTVSPQAVNCFIYFRAEIASKDIAMNYNMSVCTKSNQSLDVWVFLLKLIKSAVLPDKVDNPLSGC